MGGISIKSPTKRGAEFRLAEEMIVSEVVAYIESRMDKGTKNDLDNDGYLVICLSQFKGLCNDEVARNRVVSTYVASGYRADMFIRKSCPACKRRDGWHIKIKVF